VKKVKIIVRGGPFGSEYRLRGSLLLGKWDVGEALSASIGFDNDDVVTL